MASNKSGVFDMLVRAKGLFAWHDRESNVSLVSAVSVVSVVSGGSVVSVVSVDSLCCSSYLEGRSKK